MEISMLYIECLPKYSAVHVYLKLVYAVGVDETVNLTFFQRVPCQGFLHYIISWHFVTYLSHETPVSLDGQFLGTKEMLNVSF